MTTISQAKCNHCEEFPERYFHFDNLTIKASTGGSIGKVVGFKEIVAQDLHFCSIHCFIRWFETRSENGNDLIFPGDQVGLPRGRNKDEKMTK